MNRLIDDLLAYSRLDRRQLQPGLVEPRALVAALLTERGDELTQRGVQVHVTLPAIALHTDYEGLALALRNLLDNALKFTRDNPAPAIEIGGEVAPDSLIVWVQDNGIGFDMKHHDRIFEIFHRLHRADEYAGTGIGLAIVRRALERMGGRAWADSRPGGPTTFYLQLPMLQTQGLA
jgi:signal transduction histidine kinase